MQRVEHYDTTFLNLSVRVFIDFEAFPPPLLYLRDRSRIQTIFIYILDDACRQRVSKVCDRSFSDYLYSSLACISI